VNLSVQQQTNIRQSVLSARNVARVRDVNFAVNVGAVVPSRVHVVSIRTFPVLVQDFPQFRDNEFFVADDDIVVLDRSRRIVDVVPVGPRSRFAHAGSSGGGGSVSGGGGSVAALNLSREEIIEVQQVLIEQGFLTGQPTGVLDARTHDAIVSFQQQKGIQVTGSIDTQTVSSLGLSGRIRGGSSGSATTGQGGGQQMQNPSTSGQGQNQGQTPGQAAPQQNMGNQGANQPNAQPPQQTQGTTGQAPSGGMQQQPPPAQNQPMQNPSMGGQGGAQQPAAPAPQNQNRPSR
jgi:hypothetical protein